MALSLSLSNSLGSVATLSKGVGWKPVDLGAALYDMWDADQAASLTLSGASVNSWQTAKNGYSAAQAISAGKPQYSASAFNGRGNVRFDGSDDELTLAGVGNFPTGAAPCEIWALVDQQLPTTTPGVRCIVGYGSDSGNASRRLLREVVGGVNRAQILVGNGTSTVAVNDTNVDFTGKHVVRAQIRATGASISVDGQPPVSAAVSPATGTTRTRLGATNFSTAQAFWSGDIAFVAITTELTTEQSAKMLAYLKSRGGIA